MSVVQVRLVDRRVAAAVPDWLLVTLVAAAVLVVTGIPYSAAYAFTPPGKVFMGIVLNVPDTAQYLSWARELSHAWLIEDKLTSESGDPVFFNLFWLVVGRLASALGLGLAQTLQALRPLAGALYLGAIYWFVGLVGGARSHRWVAFLVIATGGGLGWIWVVYKQAAGSLPYPLDLYVSEPNTFLTVMAFPFAAVAGAMIVAILGLAALAFERDSLRVALAAGVVALLLGLQHGYDLLIVYAVVGPTALVLALRAGFRPRPLVLGAAICVPSVPAAAYLAYITHESPIWRGVLAQYGNAGVYTPDPLHLLILMGLPLVAIVVAGLPRAVGQGWRGLGRTLRAEPRELLLAVWLVAGFFLLYIPTDFQIKMFSAWQVPVGIVATRLVMARFASGASSSPIATARRLDVVVGLLFVLSVLPVNAYLLVWRTVDLARGEYPYYLGQDEVAAMQWLDRNSDPSDVVLSSLTIGQYVPSQAGDRAFLAHWAQTLDFYAKRDAVARFFDAAEPDRSRLKLLTDQRIRYVFVGPAERSIGSYDPSTASYLRPVFVSPSVTVYDVVPTSAGRVGASP
ncbi:MAG TPA: hypothetical protein VFC93_20620 [Chloroflexota bacterium]|nr:hypothetical protein [Chloroflexota bacterium]